VKYGLGRISELHKGMHFRHSVIATTTFVGERGMTEWLLSSDCWVIRVATEVLFLALRTAIAVTVIDGFEIDRHYFAMPTTAWL